MKKYMKLSIFFMLLFLFIGTSSTSAEVQRIYDDANLLTNQEVTDLEEKAVEYYEEWKVDFIIITTKDAGGKDIEKYMGDFTDELAEKFNRSQDNMIVLTMDMASRDFYVAGFGLTKKYLNSERINSTINKVSSDLSKEDYYDAFMLFFKWTENYLGVSLDKDPNSIYFNTSFQIAVALALAGVIVFFMAYNSGGRVTVTNKTYMDQDNSRIVQKQDRYIRKTLTKRKKPSNNSSGGGGRSGGGGGMTSGGRSYSGGRGKF